MDVYETSNEYFSCQTIRYHFYINLNPTQWQRKLRICWWSTARTTLGSIQEVTFWQWEPGWPSQRTRVGWVYNRNLADHPNELGLVGVYNRSLADHPLNQGWLGYTIPSDLADHPTNQDWLGYTVRTWLTTWMNKGQLGYTIGTWLATQQTKVSWGIQ